MYLVAQTVGLIGVYFVGQELEFFAPGVQVVRSGELQVYQQHMHFGVLGFLCHSCTTTICSAVIAATVTEHIPRNCEAQSSAQSHTLEVNMKCIIYIYILYK